ncbi:hypothetical protein N7E02_29235 [Aliirhizobium terrae]|uniref:hypothetical protein n=1 Tax=Terrirhizobium terrae TaxID=2926709 RepID=UPI002574EED7|nr:hypothetical protein [Rhizobium sp. CC-CFT758]WJH40538.1 hypothetical protein N7E02_29235 [Rhizobium sp. CC-CFT758]
MIEKTRDQPQSEKAQAERPLSIRARFLIVSLITVPSALALAALFMVSVFSANLERRLDAELTGHINNIAASLRFAVDGTPERPAGFFDKRFADAYGGLYWQIGDDAAPARLRSQSLWDYTLPRPKTCRPMALSIAMTSPARTARHSRLSSGRSWCRRLPASRHCASPSLPTASRWMMQATASPSISCPISPGSPSSSSAPR